LSGTSQVNASSGNATFSDLSIATPGSAYTLTATAGTLAPATSSAFNVTSTSSGSMLVLDANGNTISAGTNISLNLTAGVAPTSPPKLKLVDNSGNPVANAQITISAVGQQHSASGPVITNSSGIAVFVGTIDLADVYTVTATPPSGYTGGPRAATVTVGPAAASKLAFTTQPSSFAAGGHMSSVVVQIQDAFGNAVSNDTRQVDLAITSGTGASGASLTGTSQ